jgi:hypothetical protein
MKWICYYWEINVPDSYRLECYMQSLQQHGAILRSKYHRKQQRKMFPKSRCYEP